VKLQNIDIAQTASASTIVFDALRKAIITGELKDGEPLRQDEIARLFNTSRIPVREAISRLQEQGLVQSQRYKGAVVASISPEDVSEIFEFRAFLEAHVISNAVPKMTPAVLKAAEDCCDAFIASSEPMTWGDLNREFHRTLYAASSLTYHLSIIDSTLDKIDRYLRAQLTLTDGMERANSEHREILAACHAGDSDEAARLTRAHILDAREALLEHLRKAADT